MNITLTPRSAAITRYLTSPLSVLALWQPWATLCVAPDPEHDGEPPKKHETRHWYPFCERAMWPYKAWGARVKAWRHAHAMGLASPAHMSPMQARRAKVERLDRRDTQGTIDAFSVPDCELRNRHDASCATEAPRS